SGRSSYFEVYGTVKSLSTGARRTVALTRPPQNLPALPRSHQGKRKTIPMHDSAAGVGIDAKRGGADGSVQGSIQDDGHASQGGHPPRTHRAGQAPPYTVGDDTPHPLSCSDDGTLSPWIHLTQVWSSSPPLFQIVSYCEARRLSIAALNAV